MSDGPAWPEGQPGWRPPGYRAPPDHPRATTAPVLGVVGTALLGLALLALLGVVLPVVGLASSGIATG